jgi:hypothetical protein
VVRGLIGDNIGGISGYEPVDPVQENDRITSPYPETCVSYGRTPANTGISDSLNACFPCGWFCAPEDRKIATTGFNSVSQEAACVA